MQSLSTTVLVIHPLPLVRAGLVAALSSADLLRVRSAAGEAGAVPRALGEADTLPSATSEAGTLPGAGGDVIVTDPASALTMLAGATSAPSAEALRLLIVCHEEARQALIQAWHLGARSYASIATSGPALVRGVEAVARGATFCCPSVRFPTGRVRDDAGPKSMLPRGGLAPTALRRVREHIDAHLREPLALETLAALAQLSAGHFARAFRQSVGVAPHRYVNLRRIEAASALIGASDAPLARIARNTGFVDQSHFTRLFAAQLGETPSAFRRRHR